MVTGTCKVCSIYFEKRSGRIDLCGSFKCINKLRYVKATPKEIQCPVCNTNFIKKHNYQKYCSSKCKKKKDLLTMSKRPDKKNCKSCGKEYQPYTSLSSYCGILCRQAGTKARIRKTARRWNDESVNKRRGKNNPAYVHGTRLSNVGMRLFRKNAKELREKMINDVGYIYCEHCKTSSGIFDSHHIYYRIEKPNHPYLHDKINILIVCRPCHNNFHKTKNLRDNVVKERGLLELFEPEKTEKILLEIQNN